MDKKFAHPAVEDQTESKKLDLLSNNIGRLGNYRPDDRAVLMFIQRNGRGNEGEILLIVKKRGLGAGKINGPGGKLEKGESFVEAAIRECREEVGLTPMNPELRGRLYFTFADGYKLYGEVFWSFDFTGDLMESDEALPFWCSARHIPFAKMWADDRVWMPHTILGHCFSAYFYFDEDSMKHAQIQFDFSTAEPALPADF